MKQSQQLPLEDIMNFLSNNIEAASKSFIRKRQDLINDCVRKVTGDERPVSMCSHFVEDNEYIFANEQFVICISMYPKATPDNDCDTVKQLFASVVPKLNYHQDESEVPMFLLYKYTNRGKN